MYIMAEMIDGITKCNNQHISKRHCSMNENLIALKMNLCDQKDKRNFHGTHTKCYFSKFKASFTGKKWQ